MGGNRKCQLNWYCRKEWNEPANYALLLLPCGKCVCLCVSLTLPFPAYTSARTRSDVISKVTWKGSRTPRLLQLDPPSEHKRADSCFCLREKGRSWNRVYTQQMWHHYHVCAGETKAVHAHIRAPSASGNVTQNLYLSETGRRCLSTVAVCHSEIITHCAKYIF